MEFLVQRHVILRCYEEPFAQNEDKVKDVIVVIFHVARPANIKPGASWETVFYPLFPAHRY